MFGITGAYALNSENYYLKIIQQILIYQNKHELGATKYWVNSNIILGHNKKSVINISLNKSHIMKIDSNIIVFDGEIYNFIKLKKRLEKDLNFKSINNIEVLLKCIEHYGIDKIISYINGIFVFAYYDIKKNELILARDRMGLKSLYYTKIHGIIIFASNLDIIIKKLGEHLCSYPENEKKNIKK